VPKAHIVYIRFIKTQFRNTWPNSFAPKPNTKIYNLVIKRKLYDDREFVSAE